MIGQAVESAVPVENASRFQQALGKPADPTATTTTGYSRCPRKRGRSGWLRWPPPSSPSARAGAWRRGGPPHPPLWGRVAPSLGPVSTLPALRVVLATSRSARPSSGHSSHSQAQLRRDASAPLRSTDVRRRVGFSFWVAQRECSLLRLRSRGAPYLSPRCPHRLRQLRERTDRHGLPRDGRSDAELRPQRLRSPRLRGLPRSRAGGGS